MCGICGSLNHREPTALPVSAQLALLHHRGPDASGAFAEGPGVVAQSRLAVIDLAHGDPPLCDESGRIGAALNGEIYNFAALRRDLIARGHRLVSTGDTEVLPHLAEAGDAVALARALDGMFAFAVWDAGRGRLLLGRDRLGKKPLYYAQTPEAFVFASEIKAVLAHPAVPRELDRDVLGAYLGFGYVPTPRTFFAGVRSLPPGCVLSIEPGGEPQIERYWSVAAVAAVGSPPRTLRAAADGVRRHLAAAVEKRLIADVPLGAFLSGGLDSSLIVALMTEALGRPVATFTMGFDDRDGFDEREYARIVAKRWGSDHHEFVVSPNAVELVETLLFHHDQPFGDSSAIPTYLLAEQTRGAVTVALSGDGGDELFAGYERFGAALAVDRYRRLPAGLRTGMRRGFSRLPRRALSGRVGSVQRFLAGAERGLPDAYRAWVSFLDDERRRELAPDAPEWALEDYARIWEASAGAPTLERLLELNLTTYLLDDLLPKADRMSMAHGLEVRSPFLDTDLLTYARGLAPSLKLRGMDRKRVLKAVARDLLPAEIVGRRKRGFGVPLDRWFREDLAVFVRDRLGSPEARVREYLVPAAIDRLLAEHAAGQVDHGQALWLLLTLELFLRREDFSAAPSAHGRTPTSA